MPPIVSKSSGSTLLCHFAGFLFGNIKLFWWPFLSIFNQTKGDTINTDPNPKNSSLKIDYFLYSCFEFEQNCKAFPATAVGPQRWPEVVAFLDTQRTSFEDLGTLPEQMELAFKWYVEQFPALVTDHTIVMENIGELAAGIVYFALDLRLLARNDSNALEALASESNGLWTEITRIIDTHAPNYANYLSAYLRWVFVKTEEKYWEAGSRPPVGRYTPGARRSRPYGSGPSSSSGPRRSGPGGRPGGDRDRGPRSGSSDRGPRPGSGPRDRGDRPDRDRNRGPASGRPSAEGRNSHADQEQAALESVQQAIAKLRSEASVSEIRLDPSNSFFRRLQHKKAVSEGFFSFSTGEGAGRSVVVTRDKPEHEDGV